MSSMPGKGFEHKRLIGFHSNVSMSTWHQIMPLLVCLQIAAVRRAKEKGVAVSHTLLDNVRACSSTPDAAVAFFSAVLNPDPTIRLTSAQALNHPYLRCAVHQMQASYQSLTAPASATPSKSESHTQGTDILGRLASVPSYGFNMMKSLVSQAMPGNSSSSKARMRDMARYFPDYVHPSSDAELSAFQPHAHTPNDAAMPPKETPTDVRQLMAGMNQLRADFNLGSPLATPASPVVAASPGLHPILHEKAPPNTDSAAAALHAKAPPNTDSAAAALHLQRQLYPASPLSAGSGFIFALHSAHVQPFGSCEGGSDAASGQQHEGTPAQVAYESVHDPPNTSVDEAQPGSTQASCSILHTVEGQDASAEDCATAGSGSCGGGSDAAAGQQHGGTPAQMAIESMHIPPCTDMDETQPGSTPVSRRCILHTVEGQDLKDCATPGSAGSAAQPPAAVSGTSQEQEEAPQSEQILLWLGGTIQDVVEQRYPEAQQVLMTEAQAEQASCLLTADAVRESGDSAAAFRESGDSATAVRDSGVSAAAVGNSGDSAAAVGDSGDSAAAVGHSGDSAAAVADSVCDASVSQEAFVNYDTHEHRFRSHPINIDHEEEEVTAGAQPKQSLQSPSPESPGQASVQLPNQHSGALKSVEGTAARASEESLKSHALHFCPDFDDDLDVMDPSANVQLSHQHLGALKSAEHAAARASKEFLKSHPLYFCPGDDDDLDVVDPSDVANAGPVSNYNCPGVQDAHSDPDPYPYLDENAPLQQAHPAQVPVYRSVATVAYLILLFHAL